MRSLRATLTLWYTVALAAAILAFGLTITILQRRAWPGNVAELRAVVERARAAARGGVIRAEHVAPATSAEACG